MRNAVQELLGRNPDLPTAHPGLLYERFADLTIKRPRDNTEEDKRGKVEPEELDRLIERMTKIGIPRSYRRAAQRWRAAMSSPGVLCHEVQAVSRLLIGHGNPAPGEVGITLHQVYGTPVIPGSALKGLVNHYLADWGAAADESAWHGVRYDHLGHPVGAPGHAHGVLFGAPSLTRRDGGEDLGHRGGIVFEDAWLVPREDDSPLIKDVLTPHQKEYYRDFGAHAPDDWSDPNPVSFVSVRPGTRFLVAVTALAGGRKAAELALNHLLDALEQWGIGAKTPAGYGRLQRCEPSPPELTQPSAPRRRRPQPVSPSSSEALRALDDAVTAVLSPADDNAPPLAQRFDKTDWAPLLKALHPSEYAQARALLTKLTEHRGLRKRRLPEVEALIEGLTS